MDRLSIYLSDLAPYDATITDEDIEIINAIFATRFDYSPVSAALANYMFQRGELVVNLSEDDKAKLDSIVNAEICHVCGSEDIIEGICTRCQVDESYPLPKKKRGRRRRKINP